MAIIASACSRRRRNAAFSRLALVRSACRGLIGAFSGPRRRGCNAPNVPAARWPRQSLRAEEYRPSRRRMAEMPPVSAARSVSSRMRSLYFAVKLRRFGVVVSSAVAALGAATTRAGGIVGEISDPASGESGSCEGITMCSRSCALKCKLQPVKCLTLIGTEGVRFLENDPRYASRCLGRRNRCSLSVRQLTYLNRMGARLVISLDKSCEANHDQRTDAAPYDLNQRPRSRRRLRRLSDAASRHLRSLHVWV